MGCRLIIARQPASNIVADCSAGYDATESGRGNGRSSQCFCSLHSSSSGNIVEYAAAAKVSEVMSPLKFEFLSMTRKNRAMLSAPETADAEVNIDTLVSGAKEGKQESWNALVREAMKAIHGWSRRYKVGQAEDDVMQDTLLRMFRSIHTFKEGGNYFAWLRSIFVHALLDHRKKFARRLRTESGRELQERDVSVPDNALERLETNEAAGRIAKAIAKLPESLRQAIDAHLSDESTESISARLSITTRMVHQRLFWARHQIRLSLIASSVA